MEPIDVKKAVEIAIRYVEETFSRDKPVHIGLEEVEVAESEDGVWMITVGFSRAWDFPHRGADFYAAYAAQATPRDRALPHCEYKVVRVDAKSGDVRSVKIRKVA